MSPFLNIAHRGARSLAPENTLAAARRALAVGADMWELDVGVTADGELIVIHDDSLARTSNAQAYYPERAPWTFSDFTLAELRCLDFGSWFVETDPFGQVSAGAVSTPDAAAYRGEVIPTLREALAYTREQRWQVNVEIKALPAPLTDFPAVDAVVGLIEELQMIPNVIVSSFVNDNVLRAKSLNRSIRTAALLIAFDPQKPLLPLGSAADGYHIWHDNLGAEQIASLRRRGYKVIPWTVNESERMRALIAAGANGIISDFPQTLARLLAEPQGLLQEVRRNGS